MGARRSSPPPLAPSCERGALPAGGPRGLPPKSHRGPKPRAASFRLPPNAPMRWRRRKEARSMSRIASATPASRTATPFSTSRPPRGLNSRWGGGGAGGGRRVLCCWAAGSSEGSVLLGVADRRGWPGAFVAAAKRAAGKGGGAPANPGIPPAIPPKSRRVAGRARAPARTAATCGCPRGGPPTPCRWSSRSRRRRGPRTRPASSRWTRCRGPLTRLGCEWGGGAARGNGSRRAVGWGRSSRFAAGRGGAGLARG